MVIRIKINWSMAKIRKQSYNKVLRLMRCFLLYTHAAIQDAVEELLTVKPNRLVCR